MGFDSDHDNSLSVAELQAIRNINYSSQEIQDLGGIEFFTAMRTLDCYSNEISSLDLTACTALTDLNCQYCKLETLLLPSSGPLETLQCDGNSLSALNLGGLSSLTELRCGSNTGLTSLYLGGCTALTTLDLSDCAALTELDCSGNALTELDLSDCAALTTISAPNCPTLTNDNIVCGEGVEIIR